MSRELPARMGVEIEDVAAIGDQTGTDLIGHARTHAGQVPQTGRRPARRFGHASRRV
jgi:hypothetical protein